MVKFRDKKGFSITEILVVIAILAILITLVLRAGRRLKTQADEKLAKSTIGVLVAAIEHYYNYHGGFPVVTVDAALGRTGYGETELIEDVASDFGLLITDVTVVLNPLAHDAGYCSSEALFYFLDKNPECRRIIEVITESQITCKDADGANIILEVNTGAAVPTDIPLIRFIDPWGNAFRYTYTAGDTFPTIESAGPDGYMATVQDNISSR